MCRHLLKLDVLFVWLAVLFVPEFYQLIYTLNIYPSPLYQLYVNWSAFMEDILLNLYRNNGANGGHYLGCRDLFATNASWMSLWSSSVV